LPAAAGREISGLFGHACIYQPGVEELVDLLFLRCHCRKY
jgi:hypothetical protein